MRVVALETVTRRGSVALWDSERGIAHSAQHELPNAHGEQLWRLLDGALTALGWERGSIERVGVGLGPGSFTGVRVGVAFAQGIALGLGCPVVGVSSLQALAAACRVSSNAPRAPLIDARRGEVFAQLFSARGDELSDPMALPYAAAAEELRRFSGGEEPLWLGEVASELGLTPAHAAGSELPGALEVAKLAALAIAPFAPVEPLYVRPADAIKPNLPPSPLSA